MDVITFGEAMVRLAPANHRRLEQAYSLDVEIGGAELNTAIGLARLGRTSTWVSRLTDNPLGRLIVNRASETGIATHILFTEEDRVGVYFLEFGAAPRPSGIVYDRTDSAMARIQPGMMDWPKILTGANWFYVTGITAALSPSAADATLEALHAAKTAGLTTCLDPNYRAKLWSVDEARAWLAEAIKFVDVLVTNPADAERFFGISAADPEQAAAATATHYHLVAVAMTLRETPSVWRNTVSAVGHAGGRTVRAPSYEVEIVDRLGSGDAFVAGLLHGLLNGDLEKGLGYGTAMNALKHSIPGDFPWLTKAEVEALMQGGGLRIDR
ncbi:MAG TPA: sugar kinase [Gemmataceae bacterium]|jgi:2-dehydro-3-deoxygluconokinase|nr:sugar kinase [Gemmataceae bacterium]